MLPAGHTASVPLLDHDVSATRADQVSGPGHPLAVIKLANDTGTSLPPGVVTVYAGTPGATFVGDARIGSLPTGETRLLSFAQDLRSTVEWTVDELPAHLVSLTAAKGVLTAETREQADYHVVIHPPATTMPPIQ